MKKLFIAFILLFTHFANAQNLIDVPVKAKATIRLYTGSDGSILGPRLKLGSEFSIIKMTTVNKNEMFVVKLDEQEFYMHPSNLEHTGCPDSPQSLNALWGAFLLSSGFTHDIIENGWDHRLYSELEEEILDFNRKLSENNLIYYDDYIKDYIHQQINKIYRGDFLPDRSFNFGVNIVYNQNPNAFAASNGSIYITTGMLSLISSEEELVGLLAHEAAHVVLNHHIVNYHEEVKRQKRAEFWSGFATAIAAAGEAYLAMETETYLNGSLTQIVYMSAQIISDNVLNRLGAKYSREQESEADKVATTVLEYFGYDKLAYASLLEKLRRYKIASGKCSADNALSSHPDLRSRIEMIGKPQLSDFISTEYLKLMSRLSSLNAQIEFADGHYKTAERLIDQNISNGVATEIDYLLKSSLIRYQHHSDSANQEALKAINTAKNLNVMPVIGISKEEGLVLLRLKRYQKAAEAFERYLQSLENVSSESCYYECAAFEEEKKWTKIMIYKSSKF